MKNITFANTRYNHFVDGYKEKTSKELQLIPKQEKLIPNFE